VIESVAGSQTPEPVCKFSADEAQTHTWLSTKALGLYDIEDITKELINNPKKLNFSAN